MTAPDLSHLVVMTLRTPAEAARVLIGLYLSRQTLWMGLILVAALQTLTLVLMGYLIPSDFPMSALLETPLTLFAASVAGLALMVFAMHRVGLQMGGRASLNDIIVVMVWLQLLRVAAQIITIGLALIVPFLATLVSFAAGLLALYIIVHFIDQVHQLNSIPWSIAVLAISMFITMIGLSVLILLVGAPILGTSGNV
ncbi:Yip1 family protein [Arenibacterium sp. CAU 1754]